MPLRVAMDRATRAAEIVIRNDDETPLRLQVQAMSWRQDEDGRDRYEEADGLIYFPRALEVPPRESRLVRVGIRAAPVAREETYRLFIEQLPPPGPAEKTKGVSLRVLLRIGVPVFVAPAQPERKAEIEQLVLHGGQARVTVANHGNVHVAADRFEVEALGSDGAILFTRQVQERYFLAGAVRPSTVELPRELCPQVARLRVSLAGEGIDLQRTAPVEPGACR